MNDLNKKRILLVDSSMEYRRSVRGFLELEGYLVEEAATQKEALDKLQTIQFDLMLVDVRLRDEDDPNDLSGLEIAKEASGLDIPTILVTSFPTVELARTALRSQALESPLARDFITKVGGPQVLVDSISRILIKPKGPEIQGLALVPNQQLVWKGGNLINLSKYQYLLLETLFKKDSGIVTYAELIKAIYDEHITGNLAQYEKRLRNLVERTKHRIEDYGSGHEYIEAVPGRGYRLNPRFAGDPTTGAPPPKKKKDK